MFRRREPTKPYKQKRLQLLATAIETEREAERLIERAGELRSEAERCETHARLLDRRVEQLRRDAAAHRP